MKTINETFTDEEYKKLKKAKGDKTWKEFMLNLQNAHKNSVILLDETK